MSLSIHFDGREYRYLGHRPCPPDRRIKRRLGAITLLPESSWVEYEEEDSGPVLDQDGRGACNGFAADDSLIDARYVAGMPYVALSPWYIYGTLCNGWDTGSTIDDALRHLRDVGTCRDELVPYGTINPRRFSEEAHADAKRFKIEVGGLLDEEADPFAAIMTCVQLRKPVNFSVHAGMAFSNLDGDGCPPTWPGMANHAVRTARGAKRLRSGEWVFKMKNSWGAQWGIDGYCWIRREHITRQAGFQAYYVEAVQYDPESEQPPIAA
jgi:hypothetical protein